MKRMILFFFVIIALSSSSVLYSQIQYGLSDAIVTTLAQGTTVTFIDPHTGNSRNVNASLQVGTVDGNSTRFYCVDIQRTISFPDSCHRDSAVSDSYIVYILNNYYPYNPTPVNALPDINQEVAATQLAIWHYSDGVDLSTVTDATIRGRAQAIQADADANGLNTTVLTTFSIKPGSNTNSFYVETLDQYGNGVAINGIVLSITTGTLSAVMVNTDATGVSPDVEVSGAASGVITANAVVLIPQGITYACPNSQRLVLANPVYGERRTTFDYGALPVELSAFTYKVAERNVSLHWTTVSELNNSGFNIERKQVGNEEWKSIGNVTGHGTTTGTNDYSFIDRNVETGTYNYRLKQTDFNGNFEYHSLDLDIEIGTPDKFSLSQNYPNPFNPTTTINFDLPTDGFVTLKVFNSAGKEVANLVNETRTSGYHSVSFNASDLSSGVYYYRLEANGVSKVMKMALVK